MKLMEIVCPYCLKQVKGKPISEWRYNPPTVKVGRYICKCGKKFNFYTSITKTWTVPKTKKIVKKDTDV